MWTCPQQNVIVGKIKHCSTDTVLYRKGSPVLHYWHTPFIVRESVLHY